MCLAKSWGDAYSPTGAMQHDWLNTGARKWKKALGCFGCYLWKPKISAVLSHSCVKELYSKDGQLGCLEGKGSLQKASPKAWECSLLFLQDQTELSRGGCILLTLAMLSWMKNAPLLRIVQLEGTYKDHQVKRCCHFRANWKWKHISEGLIQMPFACWKALDIDHLCKMPVPDFNHPHGRKFFQMSSLNALFVDSLMFILSNANKAGWQYSWVAVDGKWGQRPFLLALRLLHFVACFLGWDAK